MNKIYYIKIHHMSFNDQYNTDLDISKITTDLDISKITPIDTGFANLEDARECLNKFLSTFAKIKHRNPKIFADSDGFTVDFYDDKDYAVETYDAQIKTMHIL